MYIIVAILIGMLIGLLRKGKIGAIFSHPYNKWYLGAIGIVAEIAIHFYYLTNGFPEFYQYLPVINFMAYLLILIMLIFNLDDIFSIIISIGLILDFVVTFINGGFLPVSESVISVMPLYSKMVQTIYSGTNGVYEVMQPFQTLMSFLGVNIPIPFMANIVVYTGTVAGLSFGGILILFGLIGLTQKAMTLKTEKAITVTNEPTTTPEKVYTAPVKKQPEKPYFESKTEELFFEEELLPKNPLDRIFGDDEPVYPTRVLPQITPLQESTEEIDRVIGKDTQIFNGLSELTRPIGTGNIPVVTVEETPKQEEKKEVPEPTSILEQIDENEGFFVTKFFAERERNRKNFDTDRLNTEELFQEEIPFNTYSDYEQTDLTLDKFKPEKPAKTENKAQEKKAETATVEFKRTEKPQILKKKNHDHLLTELQGYRPEEETERIENSKPVETKEIVPERPEITISEPEEPRIEETIEVQEERTSEILPTLEEIVEETIEAGEEPQKETSPKEESYGIVSEDNQKRYIDTNAYKKETADMDKSEEQMLDIWSQISQQNERLKQDRRRRASANYQTDNPYAEEQERINRRKREQEEAVLRAQEAEERKKLQELNQHQQKTESVINIPSEQETMSEEERIAAGYQKVTFEVGGQVIQFWKKDN